MPTPRPDERINPDRNYTVGEAAAWLAVTEVTVRRMIKDPDSPLWGNKIRNCMRIKGQRIIDAIAANEQPWFEETPRKPAPTQIDQGVVNE